MATSTSDRTPDPGASPRPPRSERIAGTALWAGLGVVSTLLGMAAAHLVAAVTTPSSSPVLAVGSQVIDLTPTPMKEWAIRQFGTADKIILVGSVVLVVLVLAGVAGVLARRRLALGAGLLVALVALAAAAAVVQGSVTELLPSLVAAVTGVASLWWLHAKASATSAAEPGQPGQPREAGTGASRRGVLVAAGALAAAAAVLGGAGRFITGLRSGNVDIALPDPASPADPFPQGLEGQVEGITPLRIDNADFYRVDTRLDTPVIDQDSWTLTIDGDVEREITLTFDDLLEMDLIERDITMTCVSNSVGGEFVGGARWLGVRLTDLLDMAGVGDTADQIYSTDFDGMTISTPLDLATDGRDAMIAIGMNGEALPRAHGFPARMIVPGLYGFISATKWITRITLTTYAEKSAYWTDRDWATDAPIKVSTRIDTPNALEELPVGENVIGGVAWAQQKGGVDKVQVRVDGGAWQDAEMGPSVNNDYWRQWFYRWDASEGGHTVAARAISGDGTTQTPARAMPFPEGASGIQELRVTVT